jgi:hypothetical protein
MPVWTDIQPHVDVDGVLRGQGADPAAIRQRRPAMVKMAEQALEEGLPLVEPRVVFRTFKVASVTHEQLHLEGGGRLRSKLIAQHLAPAHELAVLLCAIGSSLEQYSTEMWAESAGYALALDGVGSAAVEALANAACARFEQQALAKGWQTSIPLSPGMIDWPIIDGQPDIFRLLEGEPLDIQLTPSCVMLPRKTLTMVLGSGPQMATGGKTCDFCSLKEVCKYQDHYA